MSRTTAALSTRQLARRMQAELQRTEAPIDQIATSCGMGTAATLRRHFHRALPRGVIPTERPPDSPAA